jgi:hypothetical protein
MDFSDVAWTRRLDNFLPVILSAAQSARDLTWFDDERWSIVAHNVGVAAKIARSVGARGLIVDPEGYGAALFSYHDQRRLVAKRFDEMCEAAGQRGQQVMRSVATEYPDVVIFGLFGYSLPLKDVEEGKPLVASGYGLLPAFYDGMLKGMVAGATLIDGYELAYGFKRPEQFLSGYREIQRAAQLSGVRELYRQRVRAAFGLMLDYPYRVGYFTPTELREALRHALSRSDEYAWLYSEKPKFYPPDGVARAYLDGINAARSSLGTK